MGAGALTSPWLTAYYSYRAQEYALRVIKGIHESPGAGHTCVSMAKMRKMIPQTDQNDQFSSKF